MADGFTEDQLALIRAREQHARDIAARERRDANRYRPTNRQSDPTQVSQGNALASIAAILAEHGVEGTRRITPEERMRPHVMTPLERTWLLRQRLTRDVPHVAREDLFNAQGDRVEPKLDTKAMRTARYWWKNKRRRALLFCGTPGTGKTLAATWLSRAYLEDNPRGRVCWLHATQLVGAVLFRGKDQDAPTLSSFVVVDDIGRELQSPETFAEALAQLVEMADVESVVLTSNMTRDPQPGLADMSFRERYDGPDARRGVEGRLTSRLNGHVMAVDCIGEDLRGKSGGF